MLSYRNYESRLLLQNYFPLPAIHEMSYEQDRIVPDVYPSVSGKLELRLCICMSMDIAHKPRPFSPGGQVGNSREIQISNDALKPIAHSISVPLTRDVAQHENPQPQVYISRVE